MTGVSMNTKRNPKVNTEDVLKIVSEIARSIRHAGLILNERYLHHHFSHMMQDKYHLLDLARDDNTILHPEWPTYKEQTRLHYGRYRRENRKYKPHANGTAGFVDFAIGEYQEPDIGIEFSLKYGWSNEEIVYDFLKLLDMKNPFKMSISFNIIFRQERLVEGKHLKNLERHMDEAFREAVKRLKGKVCGKSRELYFIVTEIDKANKRRHWHYARESGRFRRGLPIIPTT